MIAGVVRRLLAVVVAVVAAVSSVGVPPSSSAPAVERVAGGDRYATAVAISQRAFPSPGVPVAYVASGAGFADALAAGPAAATRGGPVLLVEHGRVPAVTADELDRLRPGAIVVVGGTVAVSASVEAELARHTSGPVTRAAGADRSATAAAVSRTAFGPGAATVFVANGFGFADALAGGPAAGIAKGAVLLVERDRVPASTADELRRLGPSSIVVLGGRAAVSDATESDLRRYAGSVARAEGADRYATSVAVSQRTFGSGASTVFLATGATYPDALAGGVLGARTPGPILLVQPTCVPTEVNAEIDRLAAGRLVILGGTAAVGPGVESRTTCPTFTGPRTPTVTPAPAPAFDADAPDPDLLRVGSTFYAYVTGTTWGNRIGVLVSDRPDGGWRTTTGKPYGSTALPSAPAWQVPDTQWAPGVFAWGGRYVMFYAAKARDSGRWCVTVATASQPAGPFVDSSSGPLVCQVALGGSIDPQPFVDGSGRPWLHWKNNDGSSAEVSRVWAAPLDAGGTALAGPAQEILAKDSQRYPWQLTVDNPQMVLVGGIHYLFFSGGNWEDGTYATAYATCNGPAGPCQSAAQPILSSYGSVAGPGGGTVVDDTSGRWWLSYHAWTSGCTSYACGGARKLYVAALEFR